MSEMPEFEIEEGGKKFVINAPDEASAMAEYQRQKASGALDKLEVEEPLTERNQRMKQMRKNTGIGGGVLGASTSDMVPWQDEIMAGMSVPVGMARRAMSGEDAGAGILDRIGNAYSEEVQNQREMQKEAAQEHPVAQTVGSIAGGLGGFGPGRTLLTRGGAAIAEAVPNAVRPFEANFAQRVAKNAGLGSAYGAAYGSGEGENIDERLAGGAKGALYGAGAGVVGQAVGEGIGALGTEVVAPLMRSVRDPARQARLTTTGAIARDTADAPQFLPERGLTEPEYNWAQAQGYRVGNVDKGGQNVTDLTDAIYQRSPSAQNRINDFIHERNQQSLPMFERVIDDLLPSNNPGDLARREAALKAGRARVKPLYDAADAHPNSQAMWDEGFQQMAGGDIFQDAMKKANKILLDEASLGGGNIVKNPFKERPMTRTDPGTGAVTQTGETRMEIDPRLTELGFAPNLRYWDAVKKGLDEVINDEKELGKGLSPRGKRAQQIKERLVGRLDDLTRDRSGASLYERARTAAGQYLGQENAAEAGKEIYRLTRGNAKNSELDRVRMQASRWTPEEREMAGNSFLEALKEDMIGKSRSTTGDAGHVDLSLNFLKNEKQRRAAEILLGPQRLATLEMHNMIQRVIQYRNKSMTSNSKTWRRTLADEALSPISGAAAGGILSGGFDPQSMTYGSLLGLLTRHGPKFLANRMKTRIAPHIANEIIGDNPGTYREVLDTLAGDQQTMNWLRLMTHPLRLGAAQSSSD